MYRPTTTLIVVILCCLGLMSIVAQAQCGPNLGSCTNGNCCSQAGFCGVGELYCGAGCQAEFGAPCLGGGQSPSLPPTTSVPPTTDPTIPATLPPTTPTSEPTTPIPTLPTTTIATTLTTTDAATTTAASSTSTQGTFQLQPTGKPSSGSSAGVDSRLALVIVFLAGLLMI
ncbi:hypothetical protein BGZ47_008777 [Haplosporangium gracile]|nr:hypothetical protein BGZ47_008777 [Haplosporangium gracile]